MGVGEGRGGKSWKPNFTKQLAFLNRAHSLSALYFQTVAPVLTCLFLVCCLCPWGEAKDRGQLGSQPWPTK